MFRFSVVPFHEQRGTSQKSGIKIPLIPPFRFLAGFQMIEIYRCYCDIRRRPYGAVTWLDFRGRPGFPFSVRLSRSCWRVIFAPKCASAARCAFFSLQGSRVFKKARNSFSLALVKGGRASCASRSSGLYASASILSDSYLGLRPPGRLEPAEAVWINCPSG